MHPPHISGAIWATQHNTRTRACPWRPPHAPLPCACSTYLAGALWLSLRFSPLYPSAFEPLDAPLSLASIACYAFGLGAPVYTALRLWDELTATEQLRMKGMIVSGAVGARLHPHDLDCIPYAFYLNLDRVRCARWAPSSPLRRPRCSSTAKAGI